MYTSKDISIVVPSYNEEEAIGRCILSLVSQTELPGEIIFVDNNSTDYTIDKIKNLINLIPTQTSIFIEKEKGIPFVRNKGIEESSGSIVAFLDADCEAPSDYTRLIIDDFNSNKVSAVSGRYILKGEDQVKASHRERAWSKHFGWGAGEEIITKMVGQVGTIVSGCSAFKKDVLEELGLFDTKFLFMDDVAFSAKFYDRGFVSLKDPQIKVTHYIETDERTIMSKDIRYGHDRALISKYRNKVRFKLFTEHYTTFFRAIKEFIIHNDPFYIYELRTLLYYKIGLFTKGLLIGCVFI